MYSNEEKLRKPPLEKVIIEAEKRRVHIDNFISKINNSNPEIILETASPTPKDNSVPEQTEFDER